MNTQKMKNLHSTKEHCNKGHNIYPLITLNNMLYESLKININFIGITYFLYQIFSTYSMNNTWYYMNTYQRILEHFTTDEQRDCWHNIQTKCSFVLIKSVLKLGRYITGYSLELWFTTKYHLHQYRIITEGNLICKLLKTFPLS